MYRKLLLVALAITVILLASTCSGTGTSDTTALQPVSLPASGGLEFTDLDLDFPPPSEMAARITSLDDDWLKPGADYEVELPHLNITVEDTSLRYQVVSESDPGRYQQAHAFYAFDIINHPISTELKLIWHDYPGYLQCYIGLPVPETDEWDWVRMPSDCRIPLPDISKFLSAGMPLTVGVVLFGTEDQVLDWVRLGENAPPEAGLTVTPDSGECPLKVTLDASSSTDSDGHIVRYDWDFDGDGTTDSRSYTQSWTEHTYSAPGIYEATVTVYDDAGDYDSTFVPVTVTANNNVPPTADLTAAPLLGEPPLDVSFDASGSTDSDGEIVRYDWDFDGDGTIDYRDYESPYASHIYSLTSRYKATVTVTDNSAAQDSASVNINVAPGLNQPPVARLSADPQTGTPPLTVQYDASASTDGDGEIVSYEWDFDGDGEVDYHSGTDPFAEFTFETEISCDSTVTVTDDDGDSDTAAVSIYAGGWVHTWGTETGDSISNVVVDDLGNIYAVGGAGYASHRRILLFKYACDGTLIWVKSWENGYNSNLLDVAVDNSGNIWACGSIAESSDKSDLNDTLLVKCTSDGEPLIVKTWKATQREQSDCIAIDSEDNIYVVGLSNSDSQYFSDVLVLKYDNGGNLLWSKTCGDDEPNDFVDSAAFDNNGKLTISGVTGSNSPYMMKADSSSSIIWGKSYTFGNGRAQWGYSSFDSNGNIFISGNYHTSEDQYCDTYFMRLDQNGTVDWVKVWGTDLDNIGNSCGVHNDGYLYVTSYSVIDYPYHTTALLSVSPEGVLTWAKHRLQNQSRTYIKFKPDQPLYLAYSGRTNQLPNWIELSESDYHVFDESVTSSDLNWELIEISGEESVLEGDWIEPVGVIDTGGGDDDALIATFY